MTSGRSSASRETRSSRSRRAPRSASGAQPRREPDQLVRVQVGQRREAGRPGTCRRRSPASRTCGRRPPGRSLRCPAGRGRPAVSRSSAAAQPSVRGPASHGACRRNSRTSVRAFGGLDVGEDGHVAARFGPPGAVAGRAGQRRHRGLRVSRRPGTWPLGPPGSSRTDSGWFSTTATSGTPLITSWLAAAWIAATRSPVAPVGRTIATMACTSSSAASNSRHWRKSSPETGAVVSTGR